MKKWVCQVCGYIYEGENPPEECPVCHVGAEKFEELKGEMTWADEHRIGVAKGVDEEVIEFRADKPFTYYILDDSGNVYFAGRYVKAE